MGRGRVDKIAVVGEFFHLRVWNAVSKFLPLQI